MLLLASRLFSSAPAASEIAPPWAAYVAAGDCAGALPLLAAATEPAARLAQARCMEATGLDLQAVETAAGVTGPLYPWARLVQARALVDLGKPEAAVEAIAGVMIDGPEDELLRGRALVDAGRSAEARDGLRSLLDGPAGAEARYWLAVGAEERGELEAAATTYRGAWTKYPTSPWAQEAAEKLAALGSPVPDTDDAAGCAVAVQRAKALVDASLAAEAVPLLEACDVVSPPGTTAQMRERAGVYFAAKRYADAAGWHRSAGTSSATSSDLFEYALATARAGDYRGAAELYGHLVQRFPTADEADEASFKPGYMHHDAGELPEAIAAFGKYLAAWPKGKFAADARWFSAWDLYRLDKKTEALTAMRAVIDGHPSSELAIAARYWTSRIVGDDEALKELIADYPNSSYAWFAAKRTRQRLPAPPPAPAVALPESWLASHPKARVGMALARAGLADWARPLLRGDAAAAKSSGSSTIAVAYAHLLIEAEDYRGAKELACGIKDVPAAKAACLVRPHRDVVEGIARGYGLDVLLPYAIMNAESGLDPSVTSPAGARGLMQLMPRLADALAAKTGMQGMDWDDLYRAGTNARLGTTELGLLHGRLGRSAVQPTLPLVIAAYNGGADAVERWMGTYKTPPDADRFAEDIPFTETRRYVRRVLGYVQQYRRAYGDP
jgi:soluble lytic murein transglycosylase